MANLNRRQFFSTATGFAASLPLMGGLMAQNAYAADTSGYKALVCLTFVGGVDGSDLVLPIDADSFSALRGVRSALMDTYEDGSRMRENLLSLGQAEDGLEYGLAQEFAPIHRLYQDGKVAVVANVGPLVEPTTRTGIDNFTANLPRKLFSHNDQQSMWLTGDVEGQALGFGGRFMDTVYNSDPTHNQIYATLGLSSSRHGFLTGQLSRELVVPTTRPQRLRFQQASSAMSYAASRSDEYQALMAEHFRQGGLAPSNPFARDLADMARRGMDNLDFYNTTMESAPEITVANTTISQQFAKIARTIGMASTFGVSRQIFYVQVTGFDTHGAQAGMQERLAETAVAIEEFFAALNASGMDDRVTLFTASDFGRTVSTNGSGSDHGWGGHHFVMGGAVDGGRILGSPPPYDNTSESYTDRRMRLIPDVSVDQYVNTLGRWFGINDTDLGTILPNLNNFSTRDLGLFA